MIERLIEPVSTYAGELDNLFILITVIVMPWFFIVEGVFFWLLWRFRYKEGEKALYVTGNEPELKRWITIPHNIIILLDLVIIAGAVRGWYMIKQDLPESEHTVRVIAQQWGWSFVHEGPDGKLDTEDDIHTADELHVITDQVFHYQLESLDVLHNFSVPVFRLKQDALPGRRITGWFEATKTGEYDIQCAEMCGIGHGIMGARIVIHTPEDYAVWQASQTDSLAQR